MAIFFTFKWQFSGGSGCKDYQGTSGKKKPHLSNKHRDVTKKIYSEYRNVIPSPTLFRDSTYHYTSDNSRSQNYCKKEQQ